MQPVQQPNQSKQSLRHDDISTIIKHFSFAIQQRFQEIQKNCNYFTCLNSLNYDKSDLQKEILHRYNQYKTTDEHEIKLLQKFVDRLMQIFQFFRQKTEQPQILHTMGQKIRQKLKQILKNQSSCHFFINNRPKTHSTAVKPLGNRSSSNDFLSIVGPACKQQHDLNAVFINNTKKVRNQVQQKRTVEVGKLFKYVFSVLKRGFLIKLRMEKPQKKIKQSAVKDLLCIEENSTISVEGTCAIFRNCSEKSNKQNLAQVQAIRMTDWGKQKLSSGLQNKKQFLIYQKAKNRSVSTNQYSILSKEKPLIQKQSGLKLREVEGKIAVLYEVMNIEKYSVIKIAKDPEGGRKDQTKRNSWIESEKRKYELQYSRWSSKWANCERVDTTEQRRKVDEEVEAGIVGPSGFMVSGEQCERVEGLQAYSSPPQPLDHYQYVQNLLSHSNLIPQTMLQTDQNYDKHPQSHIYLPQSKTIKTEQIQQVFDLNPDQPLQSAVHTLIVCSSRNHNPNDSALADKSSNLMDLDRNDGKFKEFKSRSIKHDKKSLRLNLPSMLSDKSNLLNQPNIRIVNLTQHQKNHQVSQKSQHYMQNYLTDSADDGSFIPLLPKRQKNSQNCHQNKNQAALLKKKNLVPNFHPLNRCRVFRQKKAIKNQSIIQGYEVKISRLDESILRNKIRNAVL